MSYEHNWNGFGKLVRVPFRKLIHYGVYFQYFFVELWKRDFPGELNTWKMVEILTPKWTSKKAFLKTPRGHLLVSMSKSSPSRQMLWPWNLFVTTRAFTRWLLECHRTSQKFSAAENPNFFVFHKKLRGRLQNAFKIQPLGNFQTPERGWVCQPRHKILKIYPAMYIFSEWGTQELSKTVSIMFIRHL